MIDAPEPTLGMWMIYDYDEGPYLISIHSKPEAAISSNDVGYKIGFLPLDMEFGEAVHWWEERKEREARYIEEENAAYEAPTDPVMPPAPEPLSFGPRTPPPSPNSPPMRHGNRDISGDDEDGEGGADQ
jgi:hypothetical protein